MRTKETAYFLSEPKRNLKVPLETENILGRESGLKTETMSRRHCQIVTKENRWFLADLGSTNGTFLNGKKMKAREWYSIKVGDEIEFGSLVFNFNGPAPGEEAVFERSPPAETAQGEPAGFAIRTAAWIIDLGIVFAILFLLEKVLRLPKIVGALYILIGAPILLIAPVLLTGQSLGKMITGLWVANADGGEVSAGKILCREIIGKIGLVWLLPFYGASLLGNIFFVFWLPALGLFYFFKRQNVWDLLFKTRVVKTPDPTGET